LPWLREAHDRGASDVIVSAQAGVWFRVEGRLLRHGRWNLAPDDLLAALGGCLTEHHRQQLEQTGSADLAFEAEGLPRHRVHVFRQAEGLSAAFRLIRATIPTLEELRLPPSLVELTHLSSGLVLIAGAAGSGKSTTLGALLGHINQTLTRHVITLEDPIEHRHDSANSLFHQREVGRDVPSFAPGLRAALREAPDIIVVGELRDRETAAATLTAAETGHLVLATVHAPSAAVAIDRVLDLFSGDKGRQSRLQLALTLRAVVMQVLLTSRTSELVPAVELLRVNDSVAAHIRDDKTHQIPSDIQTGRAHGMMPLEASLVRLVRQGLVTSDDALAVCNHRDMFRQLLDAPP